MKNKRNDYSWNFDVVYKNNNLFLKDLKNLESKLEKISLLKEKLNNKVNFLEYLNLDEEVELITNKISIYIMKIAIDSINEENINNLNLFQTISIKWQQKLYWIENEILKIGLKKIQQFIKQTNFSHYEFNFNDFFRSKKHALKKETNKIVSRLIESRVASKNIFEAFVVKDNVEEKILWKKKQIVLNEENYLKILEESNPIQEQDFRKKVFLQYNQKYEKFKFTYFEIYKGILSSLKENTILEKFKSPLERKLFYENIPLSVFDKLLEKSKNFSKLQQIYFNLKKKIMKTRLGLKEIYISDAFLNLYEFKKKYSIEKAKEIVTIVCKQISNEYYEFSKRALEKGKIDFLESKHKQKGAFSSGNIYFDPMILMNFHSDVESILTLAHEVGHSIHSLLANSKQKLIYQGYSIYIAEIASFVLEMLTIDYLIKNAKSKEEKLYLIAKNIEFHFACFFRQSQYSYFEHKIINTIFENKILNAIDVGKIWKESLEKFNSIFFTSLNKESMHYWSRIPHFFGSPYYVFQYSTACVIATFFVNKILQNEKQWTNKFIELLKSGSSNYSNELLLNIGIDLTKDKIYNDYYQNLKDMINIFEKEVN